MTAPGGPSGSGLAPRGGPLSIRAFLTDGSLSALCQEISAITGARVRLRDERGLVLPPWSRSDAPGLTEPPGPGSASVPLVVDGERIGEITIDDPRGHSEHARTAVELLAHVASELCTDVIELRNRVTEVRVLSRLSAMLADGGSQRDALGLAIDSALEALRLDAGSIVLLPEDADGLSATEDEADLRISAARSLSPTWLSSPIPLSRGRLFDRLALAGEVVTSEDLLADDRVLMPQRCAAERLASFIGAGLIFGGRPLGGIRLYSRTKRSFTASDRRLIRSIGQQAAAAVEQARLLAIRERERGVQRALRVAADVQRRMLAATPPRHERLDVAARFVPSHDLGGDFYDLFDLRGRLCVVVGDVVGKGVPAALLMSSVRATLRAHADIDPDPARVMERVNDALCRDSDVQEFATVWMGLIDPDTLELEYVSAGHDPPALVRPGSGLTRLDAGGLVIGVHRGEAYTSHRVALQSGDVLAVYSDGLIDARNFDSQRLGRLRLEAQIVEALEEHPDAGAGVLVDRILWSVRRFVGLAPQADDETLAVVRVK